MQRIFFYSDPHFGHDNIIKYENRPFKNSEEMDEILIDNYNKLVINEDIVFFMGDIFFHSKDDSKEIIKKLKGRKKLIMGNHDFRRTFSWWREIGFEFVSPYPIIYNEFFIISHQPIYLPENSPYINLHGHTHHLQYENKSFFNCCVECNDFKPILWDVIRERYKSEKGV